MKMFPDREKLPDEVTEFFRQAPAVITETAGALTFSGFDDAVFAEIEDAWKGHADRRMTWDWPDWYNKYARSKNRVEIAIRLDGRLIGVLLGKFRQKDGAGPARLEIGYLEGVPGDHLLKGQMLELLLNSAYYCAISMGAEELRAMNPVEELKPRYQALGFKVVSQRGQPIYCQRAF